MTISIRVWPDYIGSEINVNVLIGSAAFCGGHALKGRAESPHKKSRKSGGKMRRKEKAPPEGENLLCAGG